MNTVKIAPRLRNDGPNLTRRLPPTYQLDLTKLKTSGSKRGRSPSNANNATALPTAAHIARRPNLRSPNLGRQIPAGNLATARNLLPNPSGVKQNGPAARAGAQGNASVPLPPQPPVDDNLADAITVTGGAPDWWKAFEHGRISRLPGRAIFNLSPCQTAVASGPSLIQMRSVQIDPASPGSAASAHVARRVAPKAIPRSAIRRGRSRMGGL
jgi:hypothetical protein